MMSSRDDMSLEREKSERMFMNSFSGFSKHCFFKKVVSAICLFTISARRHHEQLINHDWMRGEALR